MAASVVVNNLTVVHKDSGGVSSAFPDVCKTPSPGGPIPLPYPNVALSRDTARGSSSVKMDGNPIMLKSSHFAVSTGDEAGSAMGVASNKIKGKAYPKLYSFDVKVDGENVFRLSDIMLQNGGSPTNTPPTTEVQPAKIAGPGAPTDPDLPEVTKLAFDPAECACGDEVSVHVEGKNFSGPVDLSLAMLRRPPSQESTDSPVVRLEGGKGKLLWKSRRGPFDNEVRLTAEQTAYKGMRLSSNKLLVKTVPDARELVGPFLRRAPRFLKSVVDGVESLVRQEVDYGWEVCYALEISDGVFTVTRRVDFDLKDGASPSIAQKQQWKREIEAIWDLQFKIHRVNCKRGDYCDCSHEHGCCVYAIRISCEWGPGHGKKVDLYGGRADPKGWGTSKWWYSHTWWEVAGNEVPWTVRAHEFAHLLGVYDEYPTGACDPLRLVTLDPTSVMGGGSRTYARHMKDFYEWFRRKSAGVLGETKVLPVS
jgi:hypothetical protein